MGKMNKKQLMVTCVMGVLICLLFVWMWFKPEMCFKLQARVALLILIILILIIDVLLIHTLKDKKKQKATL